MKERFDLLMNLLLIELVNRCFIQTLLLVLVLARYSQEVLILGKLNHY